MANNSAACKIGFGNTGTGRTKQQTVLKKLFFTQYYDETGSVNTLNYTQPGTVATAGTTTVTGTGTTFLTSLKVGDPINITGETRRYISAIASNTSLTLNLAATTTASGLAYNVMNAAFFTSLINHTNTQRRLYPTTQVKNATNKRPASITKGYDDGTTIIIQQGVRKVDFIIVGADATPQLAAFLNTAKTVDCGFWGYDKDENIWGMENIAGQLDSWRIDQNTFDAIYNPGEDKDTATIMVTFDILSTEADANINSINACDMSVDVNTNIFKGLLDVTAVISNLAHASNNITLVLSTVYGSAPNANKVHGLLKTDFVSSNTGAASNIYRENNTPGDTAVTSVTESKDANGIPNGTFTVALTTPGAAADILDLNIQHDGFDYSQVNVQKITLT